MISLRIYAVVCPLCTKSSCVLWNFFLGGFSWCSFWILLHFIEIECKKWFRFLYLLSLYALLWYLKEKLHGLLCRMCTLQCLVRMFYRYLWGPFDLWCHWRIRMRYWSYYFYVRSVLWSRWCICAVAYPESCHVAQAYLKLETLLPHFECFSWL